MKRWWAVLTTAVLVSAGVVALQLWPDGGGSGDESATAPAAAVARRTRREPCATRLQDLPLAAPAGTLSLGGRVMNDSGPVAGVTVAAFAQLDSDDDPFEAECGCGDGCGSAVRNCGCPHATHAVMELALTGALERAPVARAVTDSTGAFHLTGLAAAGYDLWAEQDGSFATAMAEVAPAEDIELRLSPGISLHGTVEIEGGTVPEGTLVVAASPFLPRALETIAGPDGRFQLPPFPDADRDIITIIVATEVEGYLGSHRLIGPLLPNDGVELMLVPARTISGVVLRDGRPVPGAQVWTDDLHLGRQVADDRGAFTLVEVTPGDITLRASAGSDQGTATVMVPLDRDATGAEIDLQPRATLTGVIRDASGRPVQGASVGWSMGCSGRAAQTDASGRYLLDDLSEGPVSLTAAADGYALASGNAYVTEGETAQLDFTLQKGEAIQGSVVDQAGRRLSNVVVAVSGESVPLQRDTTTDDKGEFQLDGLPGGRVILRAEHESMVPVEREVHLPQSGIQLVLHSGSTIRVRAVDGAGQPVPEAAVYATQLSGEQGRARVSGHDVGGGESELKGLPRGEYQIEAILDSSTGSTNLRVDGRTSKTVEVRLPALGRISGQVVGRAGTPVAAAWIQVTSADPEGGHTIASTSADGEGRFELKVPLAGSYQLIASRARFRDSPAVVTRPGGSPVTLVMREPATLKGRVLRNGGTPVTTFDVNGQRQRTADGRFELEVESGDYTLVVSAPDLGHAQLSGQAESGAPIDLPDIVLGEGTRTTVRVRDAMSGAPLKGATVWLSAGPAENETTLLGTTRGERATRSDGTVDLPHVLPGAVLNVNRQGYSAARIELRGEPMVEVKLDPLATLRVQIARPDGSLVRGWYVMADGPLNRVERIPDSGVVEMMGLDEGEYTLTAWQTPLTLGNEFPRPAPVVPMKVMVPAAGRTDVTMLLRSGPRTASVTVSGGDPSWKISTVLIASGAEPLPESPDELLAAGSRLVLPLTPRSRRTEFRGLAPGRYELFALVEGTYADDLYRDPAGVVVGDQDVTAQLTIPADWRPVQR